MSRLTRRRLLQAAGVGGVALAFDGASRLSGHPAGGLLTPATPPPRLSNVQGPARGAQWARFAATATLTPAARNPFDPGEADVWGHFQDPAGHVWGMPAFWFQDYTRSLAGNHEVLSRRGSPTWMVRFTPPTPGRWTWWLSARTPGGSTQTAPAAVVVEGSKAHGVISRSPRDSRYLAYSDGSPYFAVGENTAWYYRGTYDYDDWYGQLAAQGANFARLAMTTKSFLLEWSDTGLGDYTQRLGEAWRLDYVTDLAARLGIRQVLVLQDHGPFSETADSEWNANPYNVVNRGPLIRPGDVFTNPSAVALFQRRFRYIVARWGYSPAVLAWELFGEVDSVTPYDSNTSLAWHRKMAAYVRSIDPYGHLITTSFGKPAGDSRLWSSNLFDFTQVHFYSQDGKGPATDPNLARDVSTWTAQMTKAYKRPSLMAELDAGGAQSDPEGIGLHDSLWAGAMSGSLGTGMSWWWGNYVSRFYGMFGSLTRFIRGVDWAAAALAPSRATVASATRPLVVYGLQGGQTGLEWVKNDAHQWNSPDWTRIEDATLTLSGLAPGRWSGTWWDTWGGRTLKTVGLVVGTAAPTVPVPAFAGDVALRLTRG